MIPLGKFFLIASSCRIRHALSGGRLLEIVGEAASRVPAEERTRHPDIPWPEIVGLRNRLIHGYDSVDFDILWQIVTHDLPPLIAALEKALES